MSEPNNIKTMHYMPMDVNHTLQGLITLFMHRRLMMEGNTTLAELGYFHMNSITFVEDHLEVKVYFHPDLALVERRQHNGAVSYENCAPKDDFMAFSAYMFLGSLKLGDTFTIESIVPPKYKIIRDELGRPAIRVSGPRKKSDDEEMPALVMQCNLSLTIAATHGIDLFDPNFKITYETTAGKEGAGKKDIPASIVSSVGVTNEFPVALHVQYTDHGDEDHYNPEDAVKYLLNRANQQRDARRTQRELALKISDDAAHLDKKRFNKQYGNYMKYR